ncbi:MAG: hypothetical protein ABIJ86_17440 [Spirochaetota bacterium]
MPEDTQLQEEEGTWYAYSDSVDVLVIFEESEQYVGPDDVSGTTLFWFDEVYELDDFEVIDVVNDIVSYAYGQGIYIDEDGVKSEVIFGILSSQEMPDKTFIFSIMSSELDNPATAEAIRTIISSILPSPAG